MLFPPDELPLQSRCCSWAQDVTEHSVRELPSGMLVVLNLQEAVRLQSIKAVVPVSGKVYRESGFRIMAGLWARHVAEAALFLRTSGQSAPESPTAICIMFTGTFS